MADIAIRMGVNAPKEDVDGVLRILDYIYQQNPEEDDKPFSFGAYEENFSDGAIIYRLMTATICFWLKNGRTPMRLKSMAASRITRGWEN